MKLALLACYFNPCGYQSRQENLIRFLDGITSAGMAPDLFMAECLFPGQEPAMGGDLPFTLHTFHAASILWQKEALLNALAARLPDEYTHIAIIDADVLLPPGFAYNTLLALENHPLLQPWDRAVELDPDGTENRVRSSITAGLRRGSSPARLINWTCYQPGYVWAMERSFFTEGPGLYPCHLGGSADTLLAIASHTTLTHHQDLAPFTMEFCGSIQLWIGLVREWMHGRKPVSRQANRPTPGPLRILPHGSLADRGYGSARHLLASFDPSIHLRGEEDASPVLEWSEEGIATALPDAIKGWFASRQEDGPPASAAA